MGVSCVPTRNLNRFLLVNIDEFGRSRSSSCAGRISRSFASQAVCFVYCHLQSVRSDPSKQLSPAEQLFLRYFRPATEGEKTAERLSAVEILQRIQKPASIKLPPTTLTFFGRLLQRNKVLKIHTEKGNLYCVAEVA